MLKEVVYYLLNMSIIATLIMMIVYLLRFILSKRFSKNMIFLLWIFVLIRLLVPFAISSELSVFSMFGEELVRDVPIEIMENDKETQLVFSNTIAQANEYNPIVYKTSTFERVIEVLSYIWLTGFVLLSLIGLIVTRRFINNLKVTYLENVEKYNVYTSKVIKSPIVIGVIKPKIILPLEIDKQVKEYAIIHEINHIKRHDNIWKALFTLATLLHWFNPFCWLMLGQLSKDIELACDEKVIKSLSKEMIKEYALALVSANEDISNYAIAFSGNELESRIAGIVNYKKMTKFMMILMSIVYLVLCIVLMTNGLE